MLPELRQALHPCCPAPHSSRPSTLPPPHPANTQEYDPLTLSLADALQLLAGKNRYGSGRRARKAAADAVVGGEDAGAAASSKPTRAKRGPKPKALSAQAEAEAAEAAELLEPRTEGDERREAALANAAARLALDAAAGLEINQLRMMMREAERAPEGEQAEGAAPRAGGAAQPKPRRKPTPSSYNLFFKRESDCCTACLILGNFGGWWEGSEHTAPDLARFPLAAADEVAEAKRTGSVWWEGKGLRASSAVGAKWAALSPEEKAPWERMSANLK